jgi:hypothetical protein
VTVLLAYLWRRLSLDAADLAQTKSRSGVARAAVPKTAVAIMSLRMGVRRCWIRPRPHDGNCAYWPGSLSLSFRISRRVARLASRGTVAATEAVALGDDGVLGVIGLPESAFAQLQCPRRGFRCNEIRPGKHGILRGYDAVPDIVHQEHDR